jgi:hypothetical protein
MNKSTLLTALSMSIIGTSMLFAQTVSAAPMSNTARWEADVAHICTFDMTGSEGTLTSYNEGSSANAATLTIADTAATGAESLIDLTYVVDSPTNSFDTGDVSIFTNDFEGMASMNPTLPVVVNSTDPTVLQVWPVYADTIDLGPGTHAVDITFTYTCQ